MIVFCYVFYYTYTNSFKFRFSIIVMRKVLGIFLFFFIVASVNAAIFIDDDFENRYNVGDKVVLDFKVSSDSSVSDFLESYLKCDGSKVLIDKRYVFLDSESKNFEVEFPLDDEGDCQFEVYFLNDKAVSSDFDISSEINIEYFLNDKYFFPGEKIMVSGNLSKFNGDPFSGVVDFKVDSLIDKSYSASNGSFSFEYPVGPNVAPGEYDFVLDVLDTDTDGDILNEGKIYDSFNVKSKPTSISFVAPEMVEPSSLVIFSAKLLDQIGDVIENESLLVKLIDTNSNIIFEKEVISDTDFDYNMSSNFSKGSAYLSAYYGSVSSSVPIYVKDHKEVSVNVYGNTIRFTNIGNVVYDGTVSYELDDGNNVSKKFVNVSLGLGESYIETLEYSGTYNISSEGSFFGSHILTGAAILLNDEGSFRWWSLLVFIVFLVLLFLGYCYVRRKNGKDCFFSKKAENEYKKSKYKEKDFVSSDADLSKDNVKKLIVKEYSEDGKSPKVKAFMLFLKVDSGISDYESLFRNYGFKLNLVDANLGYMLSYQNDSENAETKLFNFAKALKRFADSRDDFVSIVLNRGVFEKKVPILKKFALFNREILNTFPGKFVVSKKVLENVLTKYSGEEKSVEVMGRKISVIVM